MDSNSSATMAENYDQCYFMRNVADFTREFSAAYFFVLVTNAITCIPTILGNCLIIVAIFSTPSLHTPSNVLLIGLASTDFGVGLIVPWLNIWRIVPKLQGKNIEVWCDVQVAYTFFGVMFCGVSFLIVAAFTTDKYLALHWHLRYATIVTTKRVVYIVLAFWVIFGAMSTVQIWSMTVYRISVCLVVPLFLLSTSVIYIRIFRVLRRHKVQIQTQRAQAKAAVNEDSSSGQSTSSDTVNMVRYRKSVTSMFVVYCLFVLCYTPYICVQITVLVSTLNLYDAPLEQAYSWRGLYVAVDVTETIVILNSLMNPFIYCWRMRDIRRAARNVLYVIGCKCCS
ncbi:beta-2 adrenergic receptor [Nematostella vectensis]|uniref:beta-2 adrenergic receptor n=1 Tax=Nematostella vectensis TaxID=45351 RepID=UPI00139033C6|nr:beta-2 adrenergic receptor [Nematostella vectensis]